MKVFIWIVLLGAFITAQAQAPDLIVSMQIGAAKEMATCAKGKYLLLGNDTSFQIWEASSARLIKSYAMNVEHLATSNDEHTIAISTGEGVRLFDIDSLTFTDTPIDVRRSFVRFSSDGGKLYLSGSRKYPDSKIYLESYDLKTRQSENLLTLPNTEGSYLKGLIISPSGKFLLLQRVNTGKRYSELVDLTTKQLLKAVVAEDSVASFTFDNKLLMIEGKESKQEGRVYSRNYQVSVINCQDFAIVNSFVVTSSNAGWTNEIVWLEQNRAWLIEGAEYAELDLARKTLLPSKMFYSEDRFSGDVSCVAQKNNNGVQKIYRQFFYPKAFVAEWDVQQQKEVRVLIRSTVTAYDLAVAPTDFRFQIGKDKEAHLGRKIFTWKIESQYSRSVYTPDSQFRLQPGSQIVEKFRSMDKSGKPIAMLRNDDLNLPIWCIVTDQAGKRAALIDSTGAAFIDIQSLKFLQEFKASKSSTMRASTRLGIYVDRDSKLIAQGTFDSNSESTYCLDVATGALLWKIPGYHTDFVDTPAGTLGYNRLTFSLDWLDPQTGTIKKSIKPPIFDQARSSTLDISADGKQVFLAKGKELFILDIESGQTRNVTNQVDAFSQPKMIRYFPHKTEFALTVGGDNKMYLWDTRAGKALALLMLFDESSDWACIAPDGRFDASEGALSKMHYTKGKEIISLEALSEKYYTPGLVAQLIGGDNPAPINPDDDIKKLKLPPLVRILPPVDNGARNLSVEDDTPSARRFTSKTGRIQLTVEATANDDAVSEIRLYYNGKLFGSNARNLTVEDDKAEKKKTQTFDIQLTDGANNFRAVALNSQRTESRPDEIIVNNKATVAMATATTNASLHLIVVGINQYKNAKYNLNYATADATAFKTAVEAASAGLYAKVNAVYISDDKATRESLIAALEKVKAAAQPQDVLIFYYAGHGVINEQKEFHLVPHDVVQLYGADEALAQKGISATMMRQYSKDIKAQKQLFILDACQSAGALDQVAMRGAAEEKAIAQLARATGTHWLTASGSEQFAAEFKQLGHGTFTYVLLEALSGKADKGNDRRITVKELDAYLQEVVPELTTKYRGLPQYPASYGFGNDFPIGIVNK